jgi:hypothetical protein
VLVAPVKLALPIPLVFSAIALPGRPLRRIAVTAALVTVVSATARPVAQELWYRSYQDGVEAYTKGDYAAAEGKLLAAMTNRQAPRARGRSVAYYGQLRGEFIPEYYLAVIYAKQRKFSDALKYARTAEAYLKTGDKESATLLTARTDAEKGLAPAPLAAENRTPVTPPASPPAPNPQPPSLNESPSSAAPSTTPPRPSPRADFDRLMNAAKAAFTAQRFVDARQSANAAKALGVDNQQADDFLRSVDVQDLTAQVNAQLTQRAWSAATPLVDRLAALDSNNATVRTARQTIVRGVAEDNAKGLERSGLGAFYRGNYREALGTLGKVPAELTSPRVLFYLACSNAALALLEGEKGTTRLQRARELFRRARPQENTFAVDRKYISPRIIRVLEGAAG